MSKGRSVTIRCVCGERFNVMAKQVPLPFEGVKLLSCPGCGGEWRVAWDPKLGRVQMVPPEQRHDPTEWGYKPRLTAKDVQDGTLWLDGGTDE